MNTPRRIVLYCTIMATIASLVHQENIYAQCSPSTPASAACSGGNGAVTSGANINSGNTYWWSGSATTVANINLNGGILRVCGTLTISNLNFNSGSILVESGGSLTINASDLYLNGNTNISNKGTLTFSGNVHMQNSNNYLWNATNVSYMTVNGTFEINSSSSRLINLGLLTINNLLIQGSASAGSVCFQENAITNLTNLTNNFTNSVSYAGIASGQACIKVTGAVQLNNALTNNFHVVVCKASSVTMSGGGGWGSALVSSNCVSCVILLPLFITDFTAVDINGQVKLTWTTAQTTTGTEVFNIERSADGVIYSTIQTIAAEEGKKTYVYSDDQMTSATQYYRIRQASSNGSFYSEVAEVDIMMHQKFVVYPNPTKSQSSLNVIFNTDFAQQVNITMIDLSGHLIKQKTLTANTGTNHAILDLQNTAAGLYILKIHSAQTDLYTRICVFNSN